VKKSETVNQQWGQVENVYQRRVDLIPNLVETVKGAAKFEQETLTKVIEARASATQVKLTPEMLNDPQALQKFEAAQGELSSALSRLLVTVEQYPELKANANYLALQAQLGRHRKPDRRRAPPLQRSGAGLQRRGEAFPDELLAGMFGLLRRRTSRPAGLRARSEGEVLVVSVLIPILRGRCTRGCGCVAGVLHWFRSLRSRSLAPSRASFVCRSAGSLSL
jgi:LemA protein